ncbi:sensor histidine kinase [Sphingobacterium sp. LRF_L2]|uniref:sensor histidine kinase n=1 Tax=Sphingobacterium sp. LRF_L2 TaxID=3369421 RepID=UPI003F61C524
MKDKLKLILLLVVLAAVGILIVLGTWLYGSYHQRMGLFTAIAEQSLFEAVQEVGQEREVNAPDSVKGKVHTPWKQSLLDAWKEDIPEISADRLEKILDSVLLNDRQTHANRMDSFKQQHDSSRGERPRRERMPGDDRFPMRPKLLSPLSYMRAVDWNDTTINRVKKRFENHMKQSGLEASFTFEVKTFPSFSKDIPIEMFNPPSGKNTIAIRPFLIDPEQGRFISIEFYRPWQFLWYALSWQLVVSVLILATVLGTFFYLFITILRQNKLDVLRKAFVNSLTHELRTPVSTVYVALEALRNYVDPNDEQLKEQYHVMVMEELDHLSAMIDRVLEIAEDENAEEKLINKESTNVSTIVRKSVEHIQVAKAREGVCISLKEPEYSLFVHGDPYHLKNVINNLLDNAIKYGADQIEVILEDKTKHAIQISVIDNGTGIPVAYHQQVFEPFFRVPRGDLYTVKGFGLGLPYVKRIVQQHGGKVKLRSEYGEGCTFIITIPK